MHSYFRRRAYGDSDTGSGQQENEDHWLLRDKNFRIPTKKKEWNLVSILSALMMSLHTCIARQVNRFCLLQNWLSAELKGAIHNSHEFHLQSSVWTSSSHWDWKLSHEMGANGQPVKDGAQTFSKPWNCTALRKRRQEQKRSPNVECNESTLLPSLKRDLLLCGVFRFTIRNNEKVRIIRYPLQIHW